MLNTNFDKKANQILSELAPAVLAAPAIGQAAAPVISSLVVPAWAAIPAALLALGTLGKALIGGRPSTPTQTTPTPTSPEEFPEISAPLPQKQVTPTPTQTQVSPETETIPEVQPKVEPSTGTPTPVKTPVQTTSPDSQGAQAVPISQPVQQEIQRPEKIIPPASTPSGNKTPVIPPLQRPEEAFPVDYSLTPYAMGQSYRDNSKASPQDVWKQVFSGKSQVQQSPTEFDAPEEVLQKFKKWKQEQKTKKYEAPGAFGGLVGEPNLD